MKTNDLEARLDALESRQAIDALIAGYAQAFDNQDETLLSSLWYEDSRLPLGDFGNSEGRDAILVSARRNWRRMPHMHHWMANARITPNGDEATGTVAANCLFFDVEQVAIQVSGSTAIVTAGGRDAGPSRSASSI
jgi:hypothetical protein